MTTGHQPHRVRPRVEAILTELDRAAEDYEESKSGYEAARVRFQAASERLSTTRRLASSMITAVDLEAWVGRHPEVRFAGITIADALESYLRSEAYESAASFVESSVPSYWPWRSLENIVEALESGGFEFRSTSASREANAALINLSTVTRHGNMAYYAINEHEAILDFVCEMRDTDEAESRAEEETEIDPDSLPF